jgi:hypothetical protein
VIDRTVVGIWGGGIESCGSCRGLRPGRFDVNPFIVKNGPYEPHSKRSIYFGLLARQKKNSALSSPVPAVPPCKKSIVVPVMPVMPVGFCAFGPVSISGQSESLQSTKKVRQAVKRYWEKLNILGI